AARRLARLRGPKSSHSPHQMSRPYTTHAGGLARMARRPSTTRITTGMTAPSSLALLLDSSPSLDLCDFSLSWQQFCSRASPHLQSVALFPGGGWWRARAGGGTSSHSNRLLLLRRRHGEPARRPAEALLQEDAVGEEAVRIPSVDRLGDLLHLGVE